MPTTPEIIDTAVKIGLGALISASGAYWVAHHNHDRDAEKERLRRRRELLEEVAEQVEHFTHAALRCWSVASEVAGFRDRNQAPPAKRVEVLFARRADLYEAFQQISSAEAKLLLLGEIDAQKLLRDYGEYVGEVRSNTHPDHLASVTEFTAHRAGILKRRMQFFARLSADYAKPKR